MKGQLSKIKTEVRERVQRNHDGLAESHPKCHQKSHFDVFLDAKNLKVLLCCAKCETVRMAFDLEEIK